MKKQKRTQREPAEITSYNTDIAELSDLLQLDEAKLERVTGGFCPLKMPEPHPDY